MKRHKLLSKKTNVDYLNLYNDKTIQIRIYESDLLLIQQMFKNSIKPLDEKLFVSCTIPDYVHFLVAKAKENGL